MSTSEVAGLNTIFAQMKARPEEADQILLEFCRELYRRVPQGFMQIARGWRWTEEHNHSGLVWAMKEVQGCAIDPSHTHDLLSVPLRDADQAAEAMKRVVEDLKQAWAGLVDVNWRHFPRTLVIEVRFSPPQAGANSPPQEI